MGIIHFLNVEDGDCIWIQHLSGHNTVIDVCNANSELNVLLDSSKTAFQGNHRQKEHCVNPIDYFKNFNMKHIFRFILTHPDMDHMDGIKELFEVFGVINFWDTKNEKEMGEDAEWGRYKKEDWDFYQGIRFKKQNPKALYLLSGNVGKYFNQNENGEFGADGLYILAPTAELVEEANLTKDYNDCSYVILYRTGNNKRIIFAGDSAEKTWDCILNNHKKDIEDIDLLVAPHHGRKTGGNDEYLDVLNPKLTLFGNAKSCHLDYASWNNRGLEYITNNEANCIVVDSDSTRDLEVYVTYETFAKKINPDTFYNECYKAWHIMTI